MYRNVNDSTQRYFLIMARRSSSSVSYVHHNPRRPVFFATAKKMCRTPCFVVIATVLACPGGMTTNLVEGFILFSPSHQQRQKLRVTTPSLGETSTRYPTGKLPLQHRQRQSALMVQQSHLNLDDSDEKWSSTRQNDKNFRRSIQSSWSDFAYGIQFVHSQYLNILWKYSIVQSIAVTLPFALLLWGAHFYASPHTAQNIHDLLYYPLYSMWVVSSSVAEILHLPLEAFKGILASLPMLLLTTVEHLPNFLAIPLVKIILAVQETVARLMVAFTSNRVVPFLSSVVAVLVWRPAVEEWEYRSILNKFLFAPNALQSIGFFKRPASPSVSMVEHISVDGAPIDDAPTLPKSEGAISQTNTNPKRERRFTRVSFNNSNRILLGSILFATTRLGWLAWNPVSGDHSASPYSWTIGFVQSIMAHFSSQVLPEVRPGLKVWVLLLAIHQTVSTFLVAQNIFAKVYGERGLVASIGAHMTWTISKGTLPLRLILRLWRWTTSTMGATTNYRKRRPEGKLSTQASDMAT